MTYLSGLNTESSPNIVSTNIRFSIREQTNHEIIQALVDIEWSHMLLTGRGGCVGGCRDKDL
jgi:hypothetical protein